MTTSINHRGPDDERICTFGNLGLGFRRLSIVDLAGSSQPLSNENAALWLVFNGEVYNFPALRSRLIDLGHQFQTSGDAEVVVHSYEEFGPLCVDELRAMFAFALWDGHQQKMMLAVDPFGKKPLYYALTSEMLIFASELKALLQHPAVSRDIDLLALDEFFTYGCISAPLSIFASVRKVPPGHYLIVNGAGQVETTCYWSPRFAPVSQLDRRSLPELTEQCRYLLLQAVQRRMMSDVPLGAFLSGGVDSSSLVALMSRLSSKSVKTFSIGFDDNAFDESPYAKAIASHLGTTHYHEVVRPNLEDVLPLLARQFDEPLADSSAIPTYYVSRLARRHVTVAVGGDGGDEVFGGYKAYQLAFQAARNQACIRRNLGKPHLWGAFAWAASGSRCLACTGKSRRVRGLETEYLNITEFPPEECYIFFYDSERPLLFLPGVLPCHRGEDLKRAAARAVGSWDLLTRLQYIDLTCYLPSDILAKVDRASMVNSLEVRCPLLDRDLVEFMATVPPDFKYNGAETKIILKRATEGWLPAGALNRLKQGFSVPLSKWLRGPMRSCVEDVLFSQRLRQRGLFDMGYIRKLVDVHHMGLEDKSERIWSLVCFELWAREYLDKPTAAADHAEGG